MTTRPDPSSAFNASRTGVFDTPNSPASTFSTSAAPGLNSPLRIAALIVSSTCAVREGKVAGLKAGKVALPDGVSYLIYDWTVTALDSKGNGSAARFQRG